MREEKGEGKDLMKEPSLRAIAKGPEIEKVH
jgi:hypothetical protein